MYVFMCSDNGVAVCVYCYYKVASMYIKIFPAVNNVAIWHRVHNALYKIHNVCVRAK